METKNPQLKENEDFEQTLWNHLYLMSHRELEIDWPFDISEADKIQTKPRPMRFPEDGVRLRHYGRLVEELFQILKTMPEGEERDTLVRYTANQMKRDLALFSHGSMDDERVASDLARFTDGVIQIDLDAFKFEKVSQTEDKKKKKK
jgi:hypothetical protein